MLPSTKSVSFLTRRLGEWNTDDAVWRSAGSLTSYELDSHGYDLMYSKLTPMYTLFRDQRPIPGITPLELLLDRINTT